MRANFNLAIYDELKNGEYQVPSIYLAAMKTPFVQPTPENIRERLEKVLQRDDVDEIVAVEVDDDDDFTTIVLRSVDDETDEEEIFVFRVRFFANEKPEQWSYEVADYCNRNLLEDERIEMHQATQIMQCVTYFNFGCELSCWILQLAVIDAIVGECYALLDGVTNVFLSGAWVTDMAHTTTPPRLDLGYIIHGVSPEDEQAADYWLHTHGLLKFGLPELEIMRVSREQVSVCQGIIQTLAMRLLQEPECWYENNGEAILVAQTEQQEIGVHLMPWQTAVTSDLLMPMKKGLFKQKAQPFNGDLSEREGDDIHTEPSMVIFADIDGKPQLLSDLGELIDDEKTHMMLLQSNMETARMYYLAVEKLPLLAACFKRFAPQEGQWGYMMKLRCESQSTDATEHMWFVLKSIDDNSVTAVLVNTPFDIPEMVCDETYTLPLDSITDWRIYSTPWQKTIGPDEAYILRRYLYAN